MTFDAQPPQSAPPTAPPRGEHLDATLAASRSSPLGGGGPPKAVEGADANATLFDLPRDTAPAEVVRAALAAFPARIALVSSFGTESAVLLHMVAQVEPTTPVIFVDTGHLFAQTLDYRQELARRLGLTRVRDARAAFAELALGDPASTLWRTDTDACCAVRKVRPLDRALEGFDAWITGRKRFHGAERARLPLVERAPAAEGGKLKVNPLANWGRAELDAYAARHDLPTHPLAAQGYASVGCWPCTTPSDDARAGRWAGSQKTECGIHRPRTPAPDLGGGL